MITGTQSPKFIFDPTGTPVEVVLNNVVILKDEPEEDILIHESIFTGHREIIIKGKYWVVELKKYLFKEEDVFDMYETLKQFEGVEVRYFRHADGDYLKDGNGNEIKMFVEDITEGHLKTTDYKDLLFLRFRSVGYVDLTQNIQV